MLALLLNPHAVMLAVLQTTPDPVSWLVNYGVAGIVIALLAIGRLRTKQEVEGLTKMLADSIERERQKDIALAALMQQITQHTVPQLADVGRLIEALPERTHNNGDLSKSIADLTRRLDEVTRRAG